MKLNRNCLAAATIALGLLATACEMPPAQDRVVTPDVRYQQGVQVVEVSLDDFDIHMPQTLAPGETVLNVRNDGEAEHTIAIRGEGREWTLDPPLQPGEVREMRVDLLPGEYDVWCPVGAHAAMGMRQTLTVTRN